MAEGRQEADWAQTSLLAVLLAEPNRNKKKRSKPFTADEFNPFAKQRPNIKGRIEDLKVFLK